MARFTVMTFNIRYDEEADGRHSWRHRRDLAIGTIRHHDPDLLGLQEPTAAQWDDIATALPGFLTFGTPRAELHDTDIDPQGGFIRADRFVRRDSGMFWLSDTPEVPGSLSWPNDWGARACGWARLHDRQADRDLLFACTHFDTNAGAWLPSAKVLHIELDTVAGGTPIVLVGDFNCAARSEAHTYLRLDAGYRDAWTEAGHADEGIVTYNGFMPSTRLPGDPRQLQECQERGSVPIDDEFGHYPPHVRTHGNYRIDWILLRGALKCVSAAVDCRSDRGLLPSDHFPAIGTIEWSL